MERQTQREPKRHAIAIRHIAFEGLGTLEPALLAAGYTIDYRDAAVDDLERIEREDPDLLIVLGGPIGINDRTRYPIVAQQIAMLERRLARDRPTLGICLGAQLMAAALGADVHPGPGKEIGWAPLTLSETGNLSPLHSLSGISVLHWHGDIVELPPGCVALASTPSCPVQAFSRGSNQLGLQCHAEFPGIIEPWLIGHATELANTGIDPNALRRDTTRHQPALSRAAAKLWGEWLANLD